MKRSILLACIGVTFVASLLLLVGAADATQTNSDTGWSTISGSFSDVKKNDWFGNDVQFVVEKKLMNGISSDKFAPNDDMSRAMIVTVLWRLEGMPEVSGVKFMDVPEQAYYYGAVAWAAKNQIVSGYSDNLFAPDDVATREQLSAIMYRYAEYKGYDVSQEGSLAKYTDANEIDAYATTGMKWASAYGLITGVSENVIAPKTGVQRCQFAAILKRLYNIFVATGNDMDVETAVDVEAKQESNSNKTDEGLSEANKNLINDAMNAESSQSDVMVVGISNAVAAPGDEVEMLVDVRNNSGILGMILSVYYDDTMCDLVAAENGTAFQNVLDMTMSKALGNGARFVWDGLELRESDIKDGDILKLKFKIKENTPEGVCPITLKYFDDDIVDNNLQSLYPLIESGLITIVK